MKGRAKSCEIRTEYMIPTDVEKSLKFLKDGVGDMNVICL